MVSALENALLLSQKNVADLTTQLHEKDAQITNLKTKYEARLEKLLQLLREKFGRKSERFVDEDQIPLFETEADQTDVEDSDVEEITYTRPKTKPNQKKTLDDLPQRDVIISVSDEEKVCHCGCAKQFVRYDIKRMLHYIPAVFEVENIKRELWACAKGCDHSMVTAPVVPHILGKCRASESLLSYICISKVLDRQPLYHLEKKIAREHRWHISRQIMSRWMIQLADQLQPLVNLMKDEILDYDISALDATTLQVLNEPERSPLVKSQAYCIRGGPPGKTVTLYEYNGYKQKDYVTDLFEGYSGTISADASPVTNGLKMNPSIQMSYCHAHVRRKFETIEDARRKTKKTKRAKPGLANYVMKDIYHLLYDIEQKATEKNLNSDQRYQLRQDEAKPILEKWKLWLDEHQSLTLKESPIDNNATERDIKPFVMARKNFLFSCTSQGADSLSVHFSLIITARRHGLDPMAYYTAILKQIPFCKSISDYEALLPWNFKS